MPLILSELRSRFSRAMRDLVYVCIMDPQLRADECARELPAPYPHIQLSWTRGDESDATTPYCQGRIRVPLYPVLRAAGRAPHLPGHRACSWAIGARPGILRRKNARKAWEIVKGPQRRDAAC